MIEFYFDGACGPKNPGGRCGGGAIIYQDGEPLTTVVSEYIPKEEGKTSNNLGEFWGLYKALEWLKENNLNEEQIFVKGDSNMVINQASGNWKIKTKKPMIYTEVGLEVVEFINNNFPFIEFEWIPREQNEIADGLSKQAIGQL